MDNFSWNNIFGNAPRIEHLRKILNAGTFPHAVIFAGIEGIGKRKIAENCAAALLCENPNNGEACGVCNSCKILAAGNHPDFSVVEAENSIIKISQIRDLQDEVAMQPVRSNCRVVIIDGADFLNTPAANSLLKTLEEPTGRTVFILTTANRAGLLLTVRSRCTTVNFEKINLHALADALKLRGVDSERAGAIALIADGSLGRALQLEENGGFDIRNDALHFIENLKSFSVEDIFNKADNFPTKEIFSDFVTFVQKFLRDIFLIESAELYNADLKARLAGIKISDETLYALFDAGKNIQSKLNSNANLRLIAESYFLKMQLISRGSNVS